MIGSSSKKQLNFRIYGTVPKRLNLCILRNISIAKFQKIFLMFLSGLEIDVDQIIEMPNILYFSLILINTSVAIVLPVLKGRGETGSRFGQMIIMAAAVADILSIILFTFTAHILKNGFHFKLIYILVLFFLFFLFYKIINKLKNTHLIKKIGYQLSQAASQIRIRGAILLVLIFVVISQYIGKEVVLLGAFLSGLVLSSMLHRERSLMLIKLDGMGYGFFIPFFFIMVGVGFDPVALNEFDKTLIGFLLLLLLALFAIKVIPSLLWRRLFGFKKAISGGFLISSRLSLIIAASTIGLELGVITPGINASIIIMAVVTCFVSPVIYNWISPANLREGKKTIIIGGSSTAVLLARRLHAHGKKVIIIELNQIRFQEIRDKGINVIQGNGLKRNTYQKFELRPENYVILETGDDETNLKISRKLRNEYQHEKIISRISRFSLEQRYKQMGIETIDVTQILAAAIENLIFRPTTYQALVESFENFSVEEILITNRNIDGLQIKEISLICNPSISFFAITISSTLKFSNDSTSARYVVGRKIRFSIAAANICVTSMVSIPFCL